MTRKKGIVLAALLVLVLLGAYLMLMSEPEAPEEAPAVDLLTNYNEEELLWIQIAPEDGESYVITAFDDDKQKRYAVRDYDESLPFDEGDLSAVFSITAQLENCETIDEAAENLAQFGLDTPRSAVTLHLRSGEEKTLLIGDRTAMKDGYYAVFEGERKVCRIDTYAGELLAEKVTYFRAADLVPFWEDIIVTFESLEVAQGEDVTFLEMYIDGYDGKYRFKKPVEREADMQKVIEELLGNISGLYGVAEVVIDTPESYEPYGLELPQATVTVCADGETVVFTVGSPTEDGEDYYVRRQGQDCVLKAPCSMIDNLLQCYDLYAA